MAIRELTLHLSISSTENRNDWKAVKLCVIWMDAHLDKRLVRGAKRFIKNRSHI